MDLYELSSAEQNTYSYVRSRVLFQLLSEVGKYDPEIKAAFKDGLRLGLSAASGPTLQLNGDAGEMSVTENGYTPHISLWLPSPDHLNRMLTQRKTFLLPFPLSFKAGKAIKTFKKAIEKLKEYMNV